MYAPSSQYIETVVQPGKAKGKEAKAAQHGGETNMDDKKTNLFGSCAEGSAFIVIHRHHFRVIQIKSLTQSLSFTRTCIIETL